MPDGQGPWPSAPARHRPALLPRVLDRALYLGADNRLGNLNSCVAHPAGKALVCLLRIEVFIVQRIIDGACGRTRHCVRSVWSTRAQWKLAGISDGSHKFRNLTISVEVLWRSGLRDGSARCPTHRNMPMGGHGLCCVPVAFQPMRAVLGHLQKSSPWALLLFLLDIPFRWWMTLCWRVEPGDRLMTAALLTSQALRSLYRAAVAQPWEWRSATPGHPESTGRACRRAPASVCFPSGRMACGSGRRKRALFCSAASELCVLELSRNGRGRWSRARGLFVCSCIHSFRSHFAMARRSRLAR